MRRLMASVLTLLMAVALIVTATGCGGPADKEVTVGNKNFTEEYVVGQMMKQLLEARGYKVNLVSDISTTALRQGLVAGDVDICAEYTGTAWMTHLGHEYEVGTDNNELYELVKDEEEGNDIIWLDPIWNNNAYVLVSWSDFADDNELVTLSDLAEYYGQMDGKVRTYVDFEFSTRPDGLPALEDFYDFDVEAAYLLTGAPGTSLLGLENNQCEIAMAFGTDAAIAEHGWHVYSDDLSFFPPYDLTPNIRKDVLDKYPELEDILNELVATFPGGGGQATPEIVAECQAVWQELNANVDIDRMEPDEAAQEWLEDAGLLD